MGKNHRRRHSSGRRRSSLSSSIWAPILKLVGCIVGIAALLAFVIIATMIVLEAVFKIDTPLKPDGIIAHFTKIISKDDVLVATPTPNITPEPTATPHPMESFDIKEDPKEVKIPSGFEYRYFGDPTVYEGKMIFSAGKIVDGDVNMCALIEYDPATGELSELPLKPKNQHFVFPVFNDEWLIYLDGKLAGGGDICAYNLKTQGEPVVIKTVYVGQPELRLDGHYAAWTERTGTTKDKLFVCDLETLETTVVAVFNNSSYGTSAPDLYDGTLIWAADDSNYYEDGRITSVIKHISFTSSGIGLDDYTTGTYIHDPETNGRYFAWLDAHHSENTRLYVAPVPAEGTQLEPKMIALKVVDFYLDEKYVAYSIDEVVYVYVFESETSYRITPEETSGRAQLLGASGGYVIWMDVTSRDRDVMMFAQIPA